MNRITVIFFVVLTLILSLSKPPITNTNADKYKILIASIEDEDIFLYGKHTAPAYKGMKLVIGEKSKIFNWRCSFNRTPELVSVDLNSDEKKELVIIRTDGFGTGIHNGKINVLDRDSLDEIYVVSPIEIINKNIKSQLSLENIKLAIGNETISLKTSDYTKGKEIYNSIEFGSEIYYLIEDKHIKSVVSAQIAHGAYIGYIIINYKYENSQFVLDDIGYSEKFEG
ncbi:hypothetical protein [Abyssisolibacter fermentans]|uniref:hypothetical protein n=1 Tax=Abyssisolibacter fermentans TaxID=1766203 RepID=UPI0012E3B0D0|nr:hypothetical protein [Abyssisolibacter fermentans]